MKSDQNGRGADEFERSFWRTDAVAPASLPVLVADAVGDAEFRLLADSIPTLCWIANGDGYIVWYNRRWYDYCGATPAQMEGWGWQSVHHPDRLPEVMERWTAAVASGEPFEMTFPLRGADGLFRPFLTRATPVRDGDGAVRRWLGVNTEISAQAAAEDALREERDRSRDVLEGMAEGFVLLDGEFRIVQINAEGLRIDSRPLEEIRGRSHWEVYPGSEQMESGRLYKQAMATREPVTLETPYRFEDGRERWFEIRAFPTADGGLAIFYRDISERKRVEAEARAATTRMLAVAAEQTAILGQLAEGVIIADKLGRIGFVNEAAERLHGVRLLDVTPDDYSETYHLFTEAGDPYPSHELPLARAVMYGETIVDARWRIARPDGSEVIAIGSARPIRNSAGEQTGAVLTLRDDTERRRAEQAVRDSEERVRLVLDSAAGGFYSVDRDGVTTACSRGFLEMLGFASEQEAIGKKLHGLIHHTHPDGSPYDVADCPIYRAARSGVAAHVADELFYKLDGAPVPVEYWATPIIRDGEHVGAVCASVDISDRKAAEAALRESQGRLQAMADSIDQMIWSTLPDGFHDYYNQRWYDFTGVPEGSTDGEAWNGMFHPEDQERAWSRWRHCLATGEPYHIEYRLRHRSGEYRWVIGRALPVRGEDGAITRWYGTCTDIDDLKRAEDALVKLNDTLEQRVAEEVAERAKAEEALRQSQKMEAVGQLTGGIAHDFNNLLTVVIGNLDMGRRALDSQGGEARTRRAIENALKGAERAAALTQRLLAFARRQPLAPKPLNADRLLIGMSDLLNRSLGETIKLEIVTAPGLWRIEADPNQLEAAILNLAVNARDAMPDGGKLSIATANASISDSYSAAHPDVAPGNYIVITVGDDGAGMSKATLERVFEPFFTTKQVGKGTGLGLSQVYGFVKQSGGHVTLYSEEGQGTTVKIYLPRLLGEAEPEAETTPPDIELSGAEETLLVVEDDDDVRAYTVSLLREIGYRVLEAHDGPSALRLLEREDSAIDLLFTDVVMPGMSGRELADEARRQQPNLKVLFTSGYTKDAIVHGGRLDPGVDLVAKPFTYQALARKVRDMLESGRSGRALVIDGDPDRHAAAAAAVTAAGYTVDRSDTATEALGRVRANGGRYDFIILDTDTERGAEALAVQLRALHSDLPILLVAGADADALRERFTDDRCIGVLAKPYSPETMRERLTVLGVACAAAAGDGDGEG